MSLLLIFLALCWISLVFCKSINIITREGLGINPKLVESQMTSQIGQSQFVTIGIIDLSLNPNELLNEINNIFETSLTKYTGGIDMARNSGGMVLYCKLMTFVMGTFSPFHVGELFKHLDGIAIIIRSDAAETSIQSNKFFLRQLLGNGKPVTVIFDGSNENLTKIAPILYDSLDFPQNGNVSIVSKADFRLDDMYKNISSAMTATSLIDVMTEKLSLIKKMSPTLSDDDKASLVLIEQTYVDLQILATKMCGSFHSRVISEKIVSNFGHRVEEIANHMQKKFLEKTQGVTMSRTRASRIRQLFDSFKLSVSFLFHEQLEILQRTFQQKCRKLLERDFRKEGKLLDASKERILNELIIDFEKQARSLDVPLFGLLSKKKIDDVKSMLQTSIEEFPESAVAKLISLQVLDKNIQARNRQKKKGSRGILPSFTIVGLLRPPGYSNFQGYLTLASSMMGFPLDVLLGVQNDGDSLEVLGSDREQPLLRIQPKVHFEIDI